jgi:hypothetical protein
METSGCSSGGSGFPAVPTVIFPNWRELLNGWPIPGARLGNGGWIVFDGGNNEDRDED